MKKKSNKSTVHRIKRPSKKKVRQSQADKYRDQVLAYLHMEDEQPSRGWTRASSIYSDYVYDCLSEGASYCKQTTFGKIASDCLERQKRRDGYVYYRPKLSLYNYLLSLLEGCGDVKKAA